MELLVRWMSRGAAGASGALHRVVNATVSEGAPFTELHATQTLPHQKQNTKKMLVHTVCNFPQP